MYHWEYVTHIWFRWHVLNPFSNQLFFSWKYKKFLLSKLRWVWRYLRKEQEHLGFRSIWIWKTKPNIGSQINFLIVLAHMGLKHASREKKLPMVSFLIFLIQKDGFDVLQTFECLCYLILNQGVSPNTAFSSCFSTLEITFHHVGWPRPPPSPLCQPPCKDPLS